MKEYAGYIVAAVGMIILIFFLFFKSENVEVMNNPAEEEVAKNFEATTSTNEVVEEIEVTIPKEIVEETLEKKDFLELGLTVLPDGKPVTKNGVTYVLTDPTARYAHGVLGDSLEAGTLSIVDGEEITVIDFSPRVFEGLSPLIADIDGDGEDDIVTTLSGDGAGSQIVVYGQDGGIVATSDTLEAGWRHVLAVAPFGPNGEMELVNIVMPHVKKEVEYLRYEDGELVKVASEAGYSTHTIGSRNLGLFAVFDSAEQKMLAVPTPDFQAVAALKRTDEGVKEVWRVLTDEEIHTISAKGDRVLVNGKILE